MIIVNLKGGLGNQMFQYALGRTLSLQNDDELKIDVAGLARANDVGDIYRPFSLGRFNIVKNLATASEVRALKYPYGIFSKGWRYLSFKILGRKNTLFNPSVLKWHGYIFLDGYWQSPKYFESIRDTLLTDFTLTEPLSPARQRFTDPITATTAVSIHVRRGDYAKNPRVATEFGICSISYYQKAIATITEQVSHPTFFIFSDDIDWVKEHLPVGDEAVFVSDPSLTDTAELSLMSQCQHNIIANSSFSWWAAWLNQNPAKVVIAPAPWFDRNTYDPSLIPDSWTQLPK